MTLVDGLCVRSEFPPEWCWHCRDLPDDPFDGFPNPEQETEHE